MNPNQVKVVMSKEFQLGTGSFAEVYSGTMPLPGKEVPIALKILHDRIITGNPKAIPQLRREIGLMKSFNHRNICRVFGGWDVFDKAKHIYPSIVMERLACSLKDMLWPVDGSACKLSEKNRFTISLQLSEVFAFLHNRYPRIVHSDLKPDNILLTVDLVCSLFS
jgi:serine/threonine protein kinase